MSNVANYGKYILDAQREKAHHYYMDALETLQNAIIYFSDPDRCFEYALNLRWPDGLVICPRCGCDQHSFIKTRRIWFCKGCKQQFSLKVGTIFEDSPLGLDKWMSAFWMICNCKNGVSSMEIHRALGITQKSAWFMLHRIREAMKDEPGQLSGTIEMDETFVGGKLKNRHKNKRPKGTGRSGRPVAGQAKTIYIDEQAFRYNHRKGMNDQARFEFAMKHVFGKRLTYADLTGAGSATSH
jgi:transposase-like protein